MLSRLIATICETPIGLVSLVDADRQWCKSRHGIEDCGASREFSFCARAIERPEGAFVVPDTLEDPVFAHNPLVTGEPFIRFYAGVPLVTDEGFALGTLCVIDRKPRTLTPKQYVALATATRVVMTLLEQRVALDATKLELERASLFRSVADNATDTIVILEREPGGEVRVAYANESYASLTGIPTSTRIGRRFGALTIEGESTIAETWCRDRIAEGVPATSDVPLALADGTSILTEMCIGPGEAPAADGRQHWLLVIRDVVALERRDRERLARTHDAETDLLNEAGLIVQIELRRSRAGAFALACIDIERLDEIAPPDRSEPDAEASLAKSVARRLLAIVDVDHTIARIGPSEYAIVVSAPNADLVDAAIATYGRDLAAPYRLGPIDAIVTASVGHVHATPESSGIELLAAARARLRDARAAARSRSRSTGDRAPSRGQIETATLRDALRCQEFRLDYQPIVEFAAERDAIVGFEALLRWPRGASVGWTPLDAVVAGERSGFIIEFGRWILDQACRQLAIWQNEFSGSWGDRRLSVNVSPAQLQDADFQRDVLAALERYGCDPTGLTLELTETASMRDTRAVRDVLVPLRDLGITIDLDDFGTGYSSLSRLHTFAIDRLKIDREFISGAGEGSSHDGIANERIVETILSLAERMNMSIVAEGVETRAQRDELRRLGCRFAQGYLFGRALGASDATALLVG